MVHQYIIERSRHPWGDPRLSRNPESSTHSIHRVRKPLPRPHDKLRGCGYIYSGRKHPSKRTKPLREKRTEARQNKTTITTAEHADGNINAHGGLALQIKAHQCINPTGAAAAMPSYVPSSPSQPPKKQRKTTSRTASKRHA